MSEECCCNDATPSDVPVDPIPAEYHDDGITHVYTPLPDRGWRHDVHDNDSDGTLLMSITWDEWGTTGKLVIGVIPPPWLANELSPGEYDVAWTEDHSGHWVEFYSITRATPPPRKHWKVKLDDQGNVVVTRYVPYPTVFSPGAPPKPPHYREAWLPDPSHLVS